LRKKTKVLTVNQKEAQLFLRSERLSYLQLKIEHKEYLNHRKLQRKFAKSNEWKNYVR